MANRFVGLVAAPHTAMNPDGTLNLPLVEKQVRCLVANDIAGAFVCGSTGEGISLSTDERMRLGLRWKEALAGSMPLIIQVGHHSIAEARTLAEHAERKIAADAIASIAPSYFKPRRPEELVSFCAEVAAAAPATPFYYYHQPGNSGVDLPMARFLELAAPRIPTLAGLKFSHGDLMDFGRCLDFEAGRFDVLFGQDETLLAALALGARGAIGSTYNFAAPLFHNILKAFEAGQIDTARAWQARARELVQVLADFGGLPAIKAAAKVIGIDCGPCRAPLHTLTDEEYQRFCARLEQIGFFDYCSRIEP